MSISPSRPRVSRRRARNSARLAASCCRVSSSLAGGRRERFLNAFGQSATQTAERAEIDISYDLDLFGRLRNASEAARASLLATQAAQDNVKLAVASSAAAGYIGLRALDARLAVVRETVDARADSLKIAQRRAQSGMRRGSSWSRPRRNFTRPSS